MSKVAAKKTTTSATIPPSTAKSREDNPPASETRAPAEVANVREALAVVRRMIDYGTGSAIDGSEKEASEALRNRREAHEYLTCVEAELEKLRVAPRSDAAPVSETRSRPLPADDREITGPFVKDRARDMVEGISRARRRLDELLLETNAMSGLGDGEVCATRRERRRTGRVVHDLAIRLLGELRFLESNVETLSAGLADSAAPVAWGKRSRALTLCLVRGDRLEPVRRAEPR